MLTVRLSRVLDAHTLARREAAARLGVPIGEVALGKEPLGRPMILGFPGLRLSISHSRGLAAVVVADTPVGVDVELLRERPVVLLARRFAADEADWVRKRPGDFFHLWTQKEAVGKALGVGLRDGGLTRAMPLPPDSGTMRPIPGTGLAVASRGHGGAMIAVACANGAAAGFRVEWA